MATPAGIEASQLARGSASSHLVDPPRVGRPSTDIVSSSTVHSEKGVARANRDERMRAMVAAHFDFIWRCVRRLGVHEADVDDAVQQVFVTASKKLSVIEPGSERAFLFSAALGEASHLRRTYGRRREVPDDDLAQREDAAIGADELSDLRRARRVVDELLDEMPLDLRAVFVLFEVEEMPVGDIAALLEIPSGTAASRLRRAREDFQARLKRWQSRQERGGTR